jgi:hypothetical protein
MFDAEVAPDVAIARRLMELVLTESSWSVRRQLGWALARSIQSETFLNDEGWKVPLSDAGTERIVATIKRAGVSKGALREDRMVLLGALALCTICGEAARTSAVVTALRRHRERCTDGHPEFEDTFSHHRLSERLGSFRFAHEAAARRARPSARGKVKVRQARK